MNQNTAIGIRMKSLPSYLAEAIRLDEGYFPIPLKECREELVFIKEIFKKKGVEASYNNSLSITGERRLFWVRKRLIVPLCRVAEVLKKEGFVLHFEDAYRSLGVQKKLFEEVVLETRRKYPSVNKEVLLKIAGIYVACNPATAAHMGGAAIDITLTDVQGGSVDLGGSYLGSGPEAMTSYPGLSKKTKKIRRLFVLTMEAFGFANYPYEFWHFSMGDRIATHIQKKPYAIYGPVIFCPEAGIKKFLTRVEQKITFNVDHLFSAKKESK